MPSIETAKHLLREHIQKRVPLTDDEFEIIFSHAELRHLKKKEFLVKAGELSTVQAYMIKGCMKSFFTDDNGDEHVLSFAFEDWWMGDIQSYLTAKPALFSFEALEDCHFFAFEKAQLDHLLEALPKYERFLRLLTQGSLLAYQQRMIAFMSDRAEERYLALIKKHPGIELRITQHVIASYLGITPEALSRIRRKLILDEQK